MLLAAPCEAPPQHFLYYMVVQGFSKGFIVSSRKKPTPFAVLAKAIGFHYASSSL